ncbi:hypothetical protein QQ045_032301 [Rhodiola kirilowii]
MAKETMQRKKTTAENSTADEVKRQQKTTPDKGRKRRNQDDQKIDSPGKKMVNKGPASKKAKVVTYHTSTQTFKGIYSCIIDLYCVNYDVNIVKFIPCVKVGGCASTNKEEGAKASKGTAIQNRKTGG